MCLITPGRISVLMLRENWGFSNTTNISDDFDSSRNLFFGGRIYFCILSDVAVLIICSVVDWRYDADAGEAIIENIQVWKGSK